MHLKSHLLRRLRGDTYDGVEDPLPLDQQDRINIQYNRIFSHATASFNYTSYDVRREQDTININTHRRDVLLRSYDDDEVHPYWYARVLGIYHARVYLDQAVAPVRMDFLWVRWFGRDADWEGGPSSLRLDRIGFVPESAPNAFGFVDPANVIRAAHLVPTFSLGKTRSLLRPSMMRDSRDGDWVNYYVMRQVFLSQSQPRRNVYLFGQYT